MSSDTYAEDVLAEGIKDEYGIRPSYDEKPPRDGNSRFLGRQKRQFNQPPPQLGHDVVALIEKFMLPVDEFPRYNFVGKLLGPKGANLKEMQAFCKVRMSIMGRGSTKERNKEEELSHSEEEKYAHLKEALHVVITVRAPRIEAHRRLALAFRELNKFMGPVNEEMSQADRSGGLSLGEAVGGGRGVVVGEPSSALPPQHHPQPKICFGVPPPGAIILNEQPGLTQTQVDRLTRTEERGVHEFRDSYAYEEAYGGGERGMAGRRGDKRPTTSNGFPLKRYKQEHDHYTTR